MVVLRLDLLATIVILSNQPNRSLNKCHGHNQLSDYSECLQTRPERSKGKQLQMKQNIAFKSLHEKQPHKGNTDRGLITWVEECLEN